jgi:hypothetical protein
MATKQEKWQEIANRGLQGQFDPQTRAKFDEAVRRGLITIEEQPQPAQPQTQPAAGPTTPEAQASFGDKALGVAENIGSFVSGAVAEPIAGIAGVAQSLNPFAEEGAGARAVDGVRDALTFEPRTESGQAQRQAIGEFIEPVAKQLSQAEKFLGDKTLQVTGSPALAAMAYTLPTAALELIGVKGARNATRVSEPSQSLINKTLIDSAPDAANIRKASKILFDAVDKSGAVLKKGSLSRLETAIDGIAKSEGIREGVSGQVFGAINAIKKDINRNVPIPINEVNDLRTIARNAINPMDANVTRQAMLVMDEVDSFIDGIKGADLEISGSIDTANISKNLNNARQLWGRAKRSEMINDAIVMGASRKAGVEKGIRNELNNLLNRKNSRKFLSKEDVAAIRKVTDGDAKQNIASFIGSTGIKFENSPSLFNAMISGGGTAGVASSLGMTGAALPIAASVVAVGTAAKEVAKKITVNRANFLKTMQQAGTDGKKITRAYLRSVPKSKRRTSDLSDLLVDPNIDLSALEMVADETVKDAVNAAKFKREMAQAAAALSVGEAAGQLKNDPNDEEN